MQEAVAELERIRRRRNARDEAGRRDAYLQHRLEGGHRSYNMLDIAEASSKAALMREESRGHSYRPEFPQEDPANWTCNIVARNVNGEMKLETVPVVELD